MKLLPRLAPVALVLAVLILPGCINPLPSSLPSDTSDPAALELLAASAEAHGGEEAFAKVWSINVSYDGEWLNNVWKLQPMLVDREYRKSSVERIEYRGGWPLIMQTHTGPDGGIKKVQWPATESQADTVAGGASVLYDGQPAADPDERVRAEEAAAMVAEAYRMFLTGPFYFTMRDRPSVEERHEIFGGGSVTSAQSPDHVDEPRGPSTMIAVMAEPTTILGVACDQVLVELRPGFGTSEVDRVLVAIDQNTRYVRRVRFSLDGFRKTQGATADVEMSKFIDSDGLIFPTEFLETVVHPIDRKVHRWTATDLNVQSYSN